jgi:chromosome segregation ATPase
MNDLKKKRNDSKRLLDEIKKSPNKYTPAQIDQLLMTLGDQSEKNTGLRDKAVTQEDDLDQRLDELNAMLDSSTKRKRLNTDIENLLKQMQDDFDSFQGVIEKTPKQIEMMLKTLNEMQIGAEPDESADYWEERKTIEAQIKALKTVKGKLEQLGKVFNKKKAEYDQLY